MAQSRRKIRYPTPPPSSPVEVLEWAGKLIRALEQRDRQGENPAGTYVPSNVTTDRTFDADSTTLSEVADILGTLIEDLQKKGILD